MLAIPPGQATGCLPRETRVGEVCPLLSDRITIIPREDWQPYIGKVKLRSFVQVVLSQGQIGSCATEATSQSIMIDEAVAGLDHVLLNPWSLYAFTSGGRDQGSTIDGNLQRARSHGVLPESVWPRGGQGAHRWNEKPQQSLFDKHALKIDEFYELNTINEIGTALIRGFPVVYGWNGHSCVLTGLLSLDKAQYCNSWSIDWGDKGFGEIALSEINSMYGAFAVRTTNRKEA